MNDSHHNLPRPVILARCDPSSGELWGAVMICRLAVLAMAALGVKHFVGESRTLPTSGRIAATLTASFSSLDAKFAAQGRGGIDTVLRSNNASQNMVVFEWIHERQHAALLDLVVARLSDPRKKVRFGAIGTIERFDRSVTKPLLRQISMEWQQIKDPESRAIVQDLMHKIEEQ